MEKELMELEKEQTGLTARAENLSIVSTETLQEAVGLTSFIKDLGKRIKAMMDFHTKGLKAEIKKTETPYKMGMEKCVELELQVKSKIVVYQNEQEKIRRAEEERLRKIQEKEYEKQIKKAEKKQETPPPPPPPIKIEAEKIEGLQMRKTWVAEIEEHGLIPHETIMDFLYSSEGTIALTKFLNKLTKAGIRKIEGVRIFEKSISAINSIEDEL